ncbi:hypothetical protein ENUP19_0370G0020 [Entamoeba nuttalli]|uniref:TLDc domain-containing protein n=2 Tax=Entamoeba nuttalli TaxID=412467 RepID=K2GZI2_ENTNP|nr:hypothetical protein ENU1_131540 [Entamoeba nuttalli P19]EKE39367.1 hypothetical protein ENU1_131540 [Entamoeba nuttalli P19]|eukprot:XP_008858299.1 hypothetical protein ENU1_131540 [Entamoeba nuttalli P19]
MNTTQSKREELVQEFERTIGLVENQLTEMLKEIKDYRECWDKDVEMELLQNVPNETDQERVERIKSIVERKRETVRRNKILGIKSKEGIKLLDKMKVVYLKINAVSSNDKEILADQMDFLISNALDSEERITKKLIINSPDKIHQFEGELEDKKGFWEKKRVHNKFYSLNEKKQIEKWTGRKLGNIIFDSTTSNWRHDISVFEEKLINKQHILIIITDSEGNKFGGYVNSRIDNVGDYVYDPNAFLFSLESNERLKGMMKFTIKNPKYAFCLDDQSDDRLFSFGYGYGFGNDITIYKEDYKTESYCKQWSFNYNGINNPLCSDKYFTPIQFIVIEMN